MRRRRGAAEPASEPGRRRRRTRRRAVAAVAKPSPTVAAPSCAGAVARRHQTAAVADDREPRGSEHLSSHAAQAEGMCRLGHRRCGRKRRRSTANGRASRPRWHTRKTAVGPRGASRPSPGQTRSFTATAHAHLRHTSPTKQTEDGASGWKPDRKRALPAVAAVAAVAARRAGLAPRRRRRTRRRRRRRRRRRHRYPPYRAQVAATVDLTRRRRTHVTSLRRLWASVGEAAGERRPLSTGMTTESISAIDIAVEQTLRLTLTSHPQHERQLRTRAAPRAQLAPHESVLQP